MPQISIAEIESNFPSYLKRAESGETFVITRDGQPVFELKYIGQKPARKNISGSDEDAPLEWNEPASPLPEINTGSGGIPKTERTQSAESVFGLLKHKKPESPISLDDMENAIRKRRTLRGKP